MNIQDFRLDLGGIIDRNCQAPELMTEKASGRWLDHLTEQNVGLLAYRALSQDSGGGKWLVAWFADEQEDAYLAILDTRTSTVYAACQGKAKRRNEDPASG